KSEKMEKKFVAIATMATTPKSSLWRSRAMIAMDTIDTVKLIALATVITAAPLMAPWARGLGASAVLGLRGFFIPGPPEPVGTPDPNPDFGSRIIASGMRFGPSVCP